MLCMRWWQWYNCMRQMIHCRTNYASCTLFIKCPKYHQHQSAPCETSTNQCSEECFVQDAGRNRQHSEHRRQSEYLHPGDRDVKHNDKLLAYSDISSPPRALSIEHWACACYILTLTLGVNQIKLHLQRKTHVWEDGKTFGYETRWYLNSQE